MRKVNKIFHRNVIFVLQRFLTCCQGFRSLTSGPEDHSNHIIWVLDRFGTFKHLNLSFNGVNLIKLCCWKDLCNIFFFFFFFLEWHKWMNSLWRRISATILPLDQPSSESWKYLIAHRFNSNSTLPKVINIHDFGTTEYMG